jgi:guanylate kinase
MASLKQIFVVSAPSGAGKTTLNRRLVAEHPEVEISVSLTTRKIRAGEVNGVHYLFVDKETFQSKIESGEMLEWADVHGNFYGTSKEELRKIADRGHNAILEIDVQGWLNAQPNLTRVTSVFIMPPSLDVLLKRLSSRGTDSKDEVSRRMKNARDEIAAADNYDHFIINDVLDEAYSDLKRVIIGGAHSSTSLEEGRAHKQKLLDEFSHMDIQ